ncbi:bridge-like lipid transfer protein family member 3A [Bombina bombina]|uniref:bridge-like lipid transfer protein family member 3A n=1 Tax=Bombina bombina TaxID=8345 RepID=UPI00235AD5EF|nr:bridge-like lipid transfer protein family member 3A [Bombina bombina]
MAGIIKRQILKHLSRFTKNLSPEQINLSTLRGEGHLSDLQLDEEAIQNMLDLPTWLAITRVYCNRAAIRIQWTKLKTHPICLILDRVEVEMKTCEDPRPPNGASPIAMAAGGSEYGFAEKVVEGMFLEVGCVSIKIESRTFRASLQLWQLQSYSVSPNWQQSDLRFTRLTHPQRGELLTFKEVNWQTLRIEADASENCENAPSTPLRLLTNRGRLLVALKRRTKDCMVLSTKLSLILDDLLWVLTDSQLRALLSYTKSLSEAVQKSVQQRKERGVSQTPSSPTAPPPWSLSPPPPTSSSSLGQYFDKFDVKETSYHVLISRLDLHVCDESQARGTVSGGAIHLTFRKITLDYYPSHRSGQSCTHWHRVSPAMGSFEKWAQDLAEEREKKEEEEDYILGRLPSQKQGSGKSSSAPLYFSSILIRVDDLDINQVSSSGEIPQKPPLISCGRLPDACSAIHLQYAEYYRLPGDRRPVPCPALYIQLHSLLLSLASPSVIWLNLFLLDFSQRLQQFTSITSAVGDRAKEHRDVRLDGFNLKLRFPVPLPPFSPANRPNSVCAHLSLVTITNTRQAPGSSLPLLQETFRLFAAHHSFHWPPGPLHPVFLAHAYPSSSPPGNALWAMHSPGLSLYFEGGTPRHQEFMHPVQFTAWVCLLSPDDQLHVLFSVKDLARLQLNHYQYLTLLRAQEELQALLEGFESFVPSLPSSTESSPHPTPTIACVGFMVPEIILTLLLPPSTSSGTPLRRGESEQSSLLGSEMTEGGMGSEGEVHRLSPIDGERPQDPLNGKRLDYKSNQEDSVQDKTLVHDSQQGMLQVKESRPNSSHEDLTSEALQGKEPMQDVLQEMELLHGSSEKKGQTPIGLQGKDQPKDVLPEKEVLRNVSQGKDFARDTLLSTFGLTRETINLGRERMQRFLKDTKPKENDPHNRIHASLSRTPSQQSLDTISLESFDVLSLDSETSDGFVVLLDSALSTGLDQSGDATGSGESVVAEQNDASQSTEGPEPQQILTVALYNISSVSHLQGSNLCTTVQAMDISFGPKTENSEDPLEAMSPTSPTSPTSPPSPPRVHLQFDIGPVAAPLSPLAQRNGFLQLWIQNLSSEIPVSSLTHLGPFLEDEQPPEIIPITIAVAQSCITLRDDGPRLYPSPLPPEPVTFSLQNLKLHRKEDGIFYISGDDESIVSPLKKEGTAVEISQTKEDLQKELFAVKAELEQQRKQQQRILKELQKHNPNFQL